MVHLMSAGFSTSATRMDTARAATGRTAVRHLHPMLRQPPSARIRQHLAAPFGTRERATLGPPAKGIFRDDQSRRRGRLTTNLVLTKFRT